MIKDTSEICNDCNNDEKCILYCDKTDCFSTTNDVNSWDGSDSSIAEFWKEIRNEISLVIKSPNFFSTEKIIKFEQVVFPKFETEYALGSKQAKNSFFDKQPRIFDFKIEFQNCTFLGTANFSSITFKKGLTFNCCSFENGLILKNMIFKKGSKLRIQNCSCCDKATSDSEEKCPKIVKANFENTTFEDLADFYNSTFEGVVSFEKTNFQDIAVFSEATFKEDIDFKYTTFNKLAQFKNTRFNKSLSLENTIIKEEINFLGVINSINNILNVANRETARIIKHSFEKQNNIIEANKFYALEMEKMEEELSNKKSSNIADWIVFKFHKISSNHSQDWLLALLWMFNLTLAYSMFKQEEVMGSHWLVSYSLLSIGLKVALIECLALVEMQKRYRWIFFLVFTFVNLFFYGQMTTDFSLYCAANYFNPFSIMTGKDSLTFIALLYKTTIAYLIYQFIVSIRQNTRRN